MSLTLRDATVSDLPTIAEIYRESVLNGVATYEVAPPSQAEMAARFSTIVGHGYPYIVAIDAAGMIIGYAYASAFRTRTAYRFLVEDSIYLAPSARGRGQEGCCSPSLFAAARRLDFARWWRSSAVPIPHRSRSINHWVSNIMG